MFCDHFKFSRNFKFKTNSDLEIYKFRSVKSYMMKKLFKTDEALTSLNPQSSSFGRRIGEKEAYEIMRKQKREYNKIVKSYNDEIKKYISEVKDSFYNSYYNDKEKISYDNIDKLLNRFYERLEKIIEFIISDREKIPRFSNNLFFDLLKLNSILNVSLGSQINNIDYLEYLNFHELAPSVMYILIYIILSKLYDSDIEKLGFNPDDVEDKAFICITSENKINVVPVLDFINEIYYGLHKQENNVLIENLKNMKDKKPNKKIFKENKIVNYDLPIKDINYFCCNSLFDSENLRCDFGYKEKLFYV